MLISVLMLCMNGLWAVEILASRFSSLFDIPQNAYSIIVRFRVCASQISLLTSLLVSLCYSANMAGTKATWLVNLRSADIHITSVPYS